MKARGIGMMDARSARVPCLWAAVANDEDTLAHAQEQGLLRAQQVVRPRKAA